MTEAPILKKESIVCYSKLIRKKTCWNIARMTVFVITLVHCKSTHSDISSQKVNPSSDFLTLSKNSCLNGKPDIKSLLVPDVKKLGYAQWCPSGKGFRTLPETHPLLGIFITDESYKTYEQWPLAKKLLEIFKERSNPPVINVLVQKFQLEKARKNASQYIAAEDMKRLHFISIEGNDPSSVPQDLMEFGITGTSPDLALLDLPHFDGGWEYAPSDIAKDCGFKLEKQSESPSDSGGEYGGNVIGLPGGLVAIGSGMNDSTVTTISPDSRENVVRVNTEWLGVGHVDEFVVTVPTRDSAPCNFAILRASPALGLDLARTVAKSKDDRLEPQWPASEIFQAEPGTRTDCLAKLPRARNGKPLGAREALACPLFVKANETYEKIIDTEVSTLVARVKAATDCPMTKVIRIPHLYVPEGEDLVESFGSQGDRASSVLPNTINGQPLDSVFLTLDPLQDQFRTKLVDAIRPLGISVEFVNKVSLYVGKAGVHCGTAAIRTCNPR